MTTSNFINIFVAVKRRQMEKKTKTVDIFGTKYQIKYADSIECPDSDGAYWGITDHSKRIIVIATKDLYGKDIPDSELHITLLHELVHAILMSGQYVEQCNCEPLVEWLARGINAALKQKIV